MKNRPYEFRGISEAYSELCQTSKMERCILRYFMFFFKFAERVKKGSEYASAFVVLNILQQQFVKNS